MLELLGEFLWFCINAVVALVGILCALVAMALCYFRGTGAGRFPLFCAILAALAAIVCWLIFVFPEPPVSMIFAGFTSLAAFMAFGSWFARYDRT